MTTFAVTDDQIQGLAQKYEKARDRQARIDDRHAVDQSAVRSWSDTIQSSINETIASFHIAARDEDGLPIRARATLTNGSTCLITDDVAGTGAAKIICVLGGSVILDWQFAPPRPSLARP
jgi:hypothetical protein